MGRTQYSKDERREDNQSHIHKGIGVTIQKKIVMDIFSSKIKIIPP